VTVNALGEYSLQTDFGSLDQNDVRVDGIFAAWWDEDYDLEADALLLLEMPAAIRVEAVNEVGMTDPPNPAAGYYVNIYIHIPGAGNDNYPDWWGNGVGTDSNSLPYMTLPLGAHNDLLNVRHEGFHIFQWGAPGFRIVGAHSGTWRPRLSGSPSQGRRTFFTLLSKPAPSLPIPNRHFGTAFRTKPRETRSTGTGRCVSMACIHIYTT